MKPILKAADAEVLATLQAIDVDELLGIVLQVAKQVKTSLMSIVVSGMNVNEAILQIEKPVAKFSQYANTYINTSRSTLSQKITDLTAQNLTELGGTPYYEYFGPALIDNVSHEECYLGLGEKKDGRFPNAPYFTENEKIEFEGTFGLRWNCHHEFNLITEAYYKEVVGNE